MLAIIYHFDWSRSRDFVCDVNFAAHRECGELVELHWQEPGMYAEAYRVEAANLDSAYAQTQDTGTARSTSVGDVISFDGKMYAVASVGFVEIDPN